MRYGPRLTSLEHWLDLSEATRMPFVDFVEAEWMYDSVTRSDSSDRAEANCTSFTSELSLAELVDFSKFCISHVNQT